MDYELYFHYLAEEEMDEAIEYFQQQVEGLDAIFFKKYEELESRILENPFQFVLVGSGVRKAKFSKFPYVLFFTVEVNKIKILSIFHQKRKPKNLLDRIIDTL